MNLQPSSSLLYNDRRLLFAAELESGGHGQKYLSGAGTYTPHAGYVFYQIDFLSTSVVGSAVFRNINSTGTNVYSAVNSNFTNITFPAGSTWNAPLTSITLNSGTAIAYEYYLNPLDGEICYPSC